jgi:hypothetical protein
MMYRATYHGPRNQDGATYETRILPTKRAVELWAADKLKGVRVKTTVDNYWRDVSRAPSVTYRSVAVMRRPALRYECGCVPGSKHINTGEMYEIPPEITIVTSVGELGWF